MNNKRKYYNSSFCLIRPEWLRKTLGDSTGKGIKIAVIDSGCDENQLSDCRVQSGISLIGDEPDFQLQKSNNVIDQLGHGSACVDIILQIAPDAEILAIKVFGSKLETSTEILVEAIKYSMTEKVDVINLSLGTKLEEALYPLYYICEKAKNENITCISSNGNVDVQSYPAIFENVISVSSLSFENKFDFIYNNDEIIECQADGFPRDAYNPFGERKSMSGNSFAAPLITGIVALLNEKHGKLNLASIRNFLKKLSANHRESIIHSIL